MYSQLLPLLFDAVTSNMFHLLTLLSNHGLSPSTHPKLAQMNVKFGECVAQGVYEKRRLKEFIHFLTFWVVSVYESTRALIPTPHTTTTTTTTTTLSATGKFSTATRGGCEDW